MPVAGCRGGARLIRLQELYVSQPRAVASLIEQAANGSVSTEK